MTTYTNDPSALALADGTAATTGNTGGAAGRAADAITLSGTGGVTVETDRGPRVYRANGNTSSVARWDWTLTSPRAAVEAEFYGAAAPTGASNRVVALHNGTTYVATVEHLTDGKLRVFNFAGTSLFTTTGTVPTTAGWRVYLGAEIGTGTGDGEIHFALYTASDGHGTSPAETFDSSTANAGTTNITQARYGVITTAAAATYDFRYLRMSDSAYTAIGPLETTPPTVAYTIGQTTKVDFSASTGSGTLTLTSVTQASGPTVGTITIVGLVASFTEPVDRSASVVLNYTLTDSGGSASGQVVVPPQVRRTGDLILVAGSWT